MTKSDRLLLTNRAYDRLGWAVRIGIPAISSLYFGLSKIWGLPGAEQVVGTLALLATFIGGLIGVSNKRYESSGAAYDGAMVVTEDGGGVRAMSMEFKGDPEDIPNRDHVSFKVKRQRVQE